MSKPETRRKKLVVVKTKSGMTETPRAKAKKAVLNEVEQTFIDFTEQGKWVLVRDGFIPASFEKKKIRKNMIPKILNKILSDEGMKNIFLTQFSLHNVMLLPKEKVAYNPKAYVYDRYNNTYSIDYVELVPNGGNYTGRLLAEHQDRYYESISRSTTHTSAI